MRKLNLIRWSTALVLIATALAPAFARSVRQKKQIAYTQFETAQRLREELNGRPARERTRRDYQRVTDAFRRVYYVAPTSSKADEAIVAVAELLAEAGRAFEDEKSLRGAIGQYEFLRREYPGSGRRIDALFTIGQIYKDDLNDPIQARTTFEEFLKRYPHHRLAAEAQQAIEEITQAAQNGQKKNGKKEAEKKRNQNVLVTGIRHWSTPDYTRVAIDLEEEIKYEAGRIPNPDRIFFDLHDTKLASVLVGKSFDVEDGFLRKVRIAQFQKGLTRVVLEVDAVSDYSAFLLPNPYRLIVDIHGKQPQTAVAKKESPREPKKSVKEAKQAKETKEVASAANSEEAPAPAAKSKAESRRKDDAEPEVVRLFPPEDKGHDRALNQPAAEKKVEKPVEVAKLDAPELKSTDKPTTAPTFQSVAPRNARKSKRKTEPVVREAKPTSNGERSLIRALGLKIGKIVVDAGHGGHDTGTIGPNGLQEKDLVLDVALRLGRLLESKLGADVIYTRDDDTFVPLETRTAVANQNQADLFISIHANSSDDPGARGIETYYLNFTSSRDALEVAARENAVSEKSIHELQDLVKKIALKEKIEESREFAAEVQQALHSGLAAKAPSIRNRGVKKAPFIVLIGANMPSVLAEISFVSNPSDERRLQSPEYRQKIAEYLYRGISKYIGGLSGVKVAKVAKGSE